MINPEELIAVAYKTERVISRRLAKKSGISEEAALQQTLEIVAGDRPLRDLIAARLQAKLDAAQKIIARDQHKANQREQRAAKTKPDASAWLAWFDGSSHPNPGKIGIGGILKSPDGRTIEISCAAGHGSSNDAEYLALIAVLEAAVRLQPAMLVVYGDSQIVINEMSDASSLGAGSLQHHREHAKQLLSQLSSVTLTWIPRHKNSAADALSNSVSYAGVPPTANQA